jgi:hypothetical protein
MSRRTPKYTSVAISIFTSQTVTSLTNTLLGVPHHMNSYSSLAALFLGELTCKLDFVTEQFHRDHFVIRMNTKFYPTPNK